MSAHNPAGLTDEQIGVAEGWRLLTNAEVDIISPQAEAIQRFRNGQWLPYTNDHWAETTYRTLLQPSRLRKARGLDLEAVVTQPYEAHLKQLQKLQENALEIAILRSKLAYADKRCAGQAEALRVAKIAVNANQVRWGEYKTRYREIHQITQAMRAAQMENMNNDALATIAGLEKGAK